MGSLLFEEKPNYQGYRQLFSDLMADNGLANDQVYDWMVPLEEREAYLRFIASRFKVAETDKLKAQHAKSKALLSQRGQELLAATRTRDTTHAKLNAEVANAETTLASARNRLASVKQDEINRTGIASLKVRFNSVFGYYIEVTRANLDKVPPHYIRKQTIANGERFITPELKEMEGKILGSEERSVKLEYEIFLRLREAVLARLADIQRTADALAQLDVLAGFAETARLFAFVRPHVGDEGILKIRDGRHPVLDQNAAGERFVPNDTELDRTTSQLALITGPNMAGKSTYIRQVALLALLAHTGSFVPAAEARIDLVDRIFTRIGASDDLARGQSTFMVEMSEKIGRAHV